MTDKPGRIFDIAALGSITLAFLDIVPKMAALFGAIYYAILVWETKTVRRLTGRDT